MPNIQQPEMRRSGEDPLVTSSVKDTARKSLKNTKGDDRVLHKVPEDQQSPYGPSKTG
jgi:hypothetical protein